MNAEKAPLSNMSADLSIRISPKMKELIALWCQKKGMSKAQLVREALQNYFDHEADLVGSRAYFQKSLRERVDELEKKLEEQLDKALGRLVQAIVNFNVTVGCLRLCLGLRDWGEISPVVERLVLESARLVCVSRVLVGP